MTVLVNELVVKATIADPADNGKRSPASDRPEQIDRQEIVEACVEEVLRILERQKER